MNSIIVPCSSCNGNNRVPTDKQHLPAKCGRCGASLDLGTRVVPVELDDHTLQRFLAGCSLPVMVDFYSRNCGPCRALMPVIATAARRFHGQVVVAQINADCNPGSSGHFQIRGVPTLIFFARGSEVDRLVGAPPVEELNDRLSAISNNM